MFAGVHFRHAVEEGAKLGATVAQAVLSQFEGEWVQGACGVSDQSCRGRAWCGHSSCICTATTSCVSVTVPADKFAKKN